MTAGMIVVSVAAILSLLMYAQATYRKRLLAQRARAEAAAAKVVFFSRNAVRRDLARSRIGF